MLYDNKNLTDELISVYTNNENGYGGYFPLGINNIWHSGIHINNRDEIFPFRPGELVAYNICEDYVKTPWPKYLSAVIYNKLSNDNKKKYICKAFGGYEIKNENDTENSSNCFILLKHNVRLSKNMSNKSDFSFYTLYMNLMPLKGNPLLKDYYNNYKQVTSDLPKEPFYSEWQIKINDTNGLNSIYKYNKGTNIFEKSKFKIVKKTFAYSDYKSLKEAPSENNPKLPANEITFLAPNSSCSDNIPLSDVELKKEVIILPKNTNFELYRNNRLGGKIGDLKFVEERYFELKSTESKTSMTEETITSEGNTVRYLKFKFPKVDITFSNNATCYIKTSNINQAYTKIGDYYKYSSSDYQNTRPFSNTNGEIFEAYINDYFKIPNMNNTITINNIECYEAKIEVNTNSLETFEIKVTDNVKVAIMEGSIKRTLNNAGNFTERNNCLICYTDEEMTNPAEIKINQTEFKPQNSDNFRNLNTSHSGYVRFDSNQYYFIDLPANKILHAKLLMRDDFTKNENKKVSDEPRINITSEDLIGYSALCEETNSKYFDFVVFSTTDIATLGEDEASFYKKYFIKYEEDSNKDDLFVEPKNFWDFFNEKNLIPQIDQNKFLCFGKDGKIDEKELLNFFTSQDNSIKKCRENFYKLICQHPIEWDSKFKLETIKKDYKNVFEKKISGDFLESWAKNLSDKLTKLSIFDKGFKSSTASKNLFHFMHPLYFLEKVHEDEGITIPSDDNKKYLPKEALDLIEVQDKVMSLNCLQPGTGSGIYNMGGYTFCNHAVFLTIIAVDKKFNNFTNRDNKVFPEADNLEKRINKNIESNRESKHFYYYKVSNYWYDILEESSKIEKTGIKEININEAQKLANQGYVVVVCYKNTAFRYGAPHYATIRPNFNINLSNCTIANVKVANVGSFVGVSSIQEAFSTNPIKFYYNTMQIFQKNMSYINQFN